MQDLATQIRKLVEKYNISKLDLVKLFELISAQKEFGTFSFSSELEKLKKESNKIKKYYKIGFMDYGYLIGFLQKSTLEIIENLDKFSEIESKNRKKEIENKKLSEKKAEQERQNKIKKSEEKYKKRKEKILEESKKREEEYKKRDAEKKQEIRERIKKYEAKAKNKTKEEREQEKAGSRIIMLGIGLIVIIVLMFRSCGGSGGNSNYSECECVEFFRDAAGMSLDPEYLLKPHHFSEATRCVKDYVYNEKDGRLNINPCFSKAWKDKRDHSYMSSGATALQDFLQKAYQCDCK